VLDARNGKVVRRHSAAFEGHENCFPIRGGTPAFIGCNDPGAMTLLRVDASDAKPVVERSFKGVYTQDFGEPPEQAPLALAKRCDGSSEVGALCVRREEKTWKQLPQPADPQKLMAQIPFIVHVAASEDGFAYAFGWLGGGGDLVVVDSRANKVRRIDKGSLPKWASEGIRWGALGIEDGTLRFLIAGDSPGVLEIRADDSIQAERLQGRMASVGSRALLITAQGGLRETLDGGRSFHDVAPPPGGAPDSGFFRCVAAGCSLGPWHRVGWGP